MKTDIEKLEQEYQALQKDHSEAEWSSIKFLMSKSAELESENLFLSFRLLQRAKNLEPENKKLKEAYERVRAAVKTKTQAYYKCVLSKKKLKKNWLPQRKKLHQFINF
ncbi:hypothetical protein [Psychrosphaera haliotis]|uniref:Uncharacterized protein n=1 Tax=Psychrosphaera haliotis TaxID=555083 RepID=A0A6N8F8H6_9GAMM|nr:hypothetical protein [Psychrosphaera haliotis]MUH71387.1 hypothetical protein [Psychrosphaera haliotis]